MAARTSPKHLIKWLSSAALYYGGACRLYRALLKKNNRLFCTVMYHCINDAGNPYFPGIPSRDFERHLQFYRQHFTVISVEHLDRLLRLPSVPAEKPYLCITFDDGYRDNYLHAFPLLKRYNLPAIIFVSPGFVSNTAIMAKDTVNYILTHAQVPERAFSLPCEGGAFVVERDDIATPAGKLLLFTELSGKVRKMPLAEQAALTDELARNLRVPIDDEAFHAYAYDLMLRWQDIEEMSRQGIAFGAHPFRHLSSYSCHPDELREEYRRAKIVLEEHLKKKVAYFAYAYGEENDVNEDSLRLVREVGYELAFTAMNGYNSNASDPLLLRRIGLGKWSAQAVDGWFSPSVFGVNLFGLKTALKQRFRVL